MYQEMLVRAVWGSRACGEGQRKPVSWEAPVTSSTHIWATRTPLHGSSDAREPVSSEIRFRQLAKSVSSNQNLS